MPFEIVRNDITKMNVDAIVNSTNRYMYADGGADYAIHQAAGREMDHACRMLGECEPGEVKLTPGFRLPCKYVIHTVAPVWRDGTHGEAEKLAECYRKALEAAEQNKCESIAFPLMSSGINAFPRELALVIANDSIRAFLQHSDMQVYLVVYDRKSMLIGEALYNTISSLISESDIREELISDVVYRKGAYYKAEPFLSDEDFKESFRPMVYGAQASRENMVAEGTMDELAPPCAPEAAPQVKKKAFFSKKNLEDALANMDESFSDMLMKKIIASGMTDAECYKKANIDRKLFSKIRNTKNYNPSKPTVLAFAVALRLSLDETEQLLKKAGYAFANNKAFDVIVKYFIANGNYDIFMINETLFEFDQVLLGNCG